VNINLNLSNPTVTLNGVDKFLEFDIMAFASQAGTYLDNRFYIQTVILLYLEVIFFKIIK